MRSRLGLVATALLLFSAFDASIAGARALTWASAEDAKTLDPHALNESATLVLNQQIYEPLLQRDSHGKAVPALAESWTLTANPLIWEFRLRPGVIFHDGTPFTAADVVFSISRAQQPGSGMRNLAGAIEWVEAVEPLLIRIKTRGPTPLLPAYLTHLHIMSKIWTETMRAVVVPKTDQLHLSPIARSANGTGPFELVKREPGVRTVMKRFDKYWQNEQSPVQIKDLIFQPIRNDTERIAMLRNGKIDFVQDVPVNELTSLRADKAITVNVGPENRSIFLGLNVGPEPLATSTITDRNPLADLRVRLAVNIAINRQSIQKNVTLGQSIPTGVIAPPSINGYDRKLDRIPPFDIAKAKSLLAEAGFKDGFSIRLDCPVDRYVRDEAICADLARQLKAIGITVKLMMRPRYVHEALIRDTPNMTDFFMAGSNVPTFDSEELFVTFYHTRNDKGGSFNATRYSNAEVDRLTEGLAVQTDFTTRNHAMGRIWELVQADMIYIPLHIQTVAYAMKAGISIPVDIENLPKLKKARLSEAQ